MSVTADQVKEIANVTRIDLDDDQIANLVPKLNSIIGEIKKLDEVDTKGVEPLNQMTGLTNALDSDEVRPFEGTEKLVQCSPLSEGSFIKVKKAV
jgi:aspartyl-tRNA(Asn)/glutamyl-tRNA(Gln) amidotransferase subunit C